MKVLIVVAQHFNGHELWTSLGVLKQRGHTFEVISTHTDIADEVTGQKVAIKRTIDDVDSLEEFDAFMVISGNMADTELYWKHPKVQSYVDEAHSKDMPIAAICCSVPTIRNAAKGKRVSFFPLIRSEDLLKQAGAILSTLTYSVDGKLVTAEHQMATQMWAEAFCDVLEGKKHAVELVDSKYMPLGRERKPIPEVERLQKIMERTGKHELSDK